MDTALAKETSRGDNIEEFYLFLDTNLFYKEKVSYNIFFNNKLMQDLLSIRNSFNEIFLGHREIKILIPKLAVEEIYALKAHIIRNEIIILQNKIKYLEERELNNSLQFIQGNINFKLSEMGKWFFSQNNIEIVPYCDQEYFTKIIECSVNKRLPFKPKFDPKKKRFVGDNGFKDAVIWYSIICYIRKKSNKNNIHTFLLTNNEKDFKSETTLSEFKELTGNEIEIIKFEANNPNINEKEFNPFLDLILDKSEISISIEIDVVNISYLQLKNNTVINSIIAKPLDFNIRSTIKFDENFSIQEEMGRDIFNEKIKEALSKFRFEISNIKFNYYIPIVEHVYCDLVNKWDESLDIEEITVVYMDGSEVFINDELNVFTNTDYLYSSICTEEDYEEFEVDALKVITEYLESEGYGKVNPEAIDFEYVYRDLY